MADGVKSNKHRVCDIDHLDHCAEDVFKGIKTEGRKMSQLLL